MTLKLRLMSLDDVAQVAGIEKRSFVVPWSPRTYAYEINESQSSHMVVLSGPPTEQRRGLAFGRLLRAIRRGAPDRSTVLAYGGLWNLVDEAHISTIASHPEYRRRGYGEAVLAGMMRRALVIGVSFVALEVRVTNLGAQALYRKYGFEVHGIKPKYYLDNHEDAYDMRVELTDAARHHIETLYRNIRTQLGFVDTFTDATHNL